MIIILCIHLHWNCLFFKESDFESICYFIKSEELKQVTYTEASYNAMIARMKQDKEVKCFSSLPKDIDLERFYDE